ncbi:hypothetical protein V6N13_088360 [Hibiscus sabdariffa]
MWHSETSMFLQSSLLVFWQLEVAGKERTRTHISWVLKLLQSSGDSDVPVTTFFGCVMQTIHTDAAYKALSRRNSGKFEAQTSLDQSVHHSERRTPVKVNDQDETHKQLLQGQEGASKCAWSTFCNKFLKAENVDSLVNSGLVAMVPFLINKNEV